MRTDVNVGLELPPVTSSHRDPSLPPRKLRFPKLKDIYTYIRGRCNFFYSVVFWWRTGQATFKVQCGRLAGLGGRGGLLKGPTLFWRKTREEEGFFGGGDRPGLRIICVYRIFRAIKHLRPLYMDGCWLFSSSSLIRIPTPPLPHKPPNYL